MCENGYSPESNDLAAESFHSLVQCCLKSEHDRNLSKNSLKELRRYLNEFAKFCLEHGINSIDKLTPALLKDYSDFRGTNSGPNLKKAVVWSLRKFSKYLAFTQHVKGDLARNLHHPKFHPRSELPEYLTHNELRRLLEYSAAHLEFRDFTIISLMVSTGVRPNEIAQLKRVDIHLDTFQIDVPVKGGWVKKTPLSIPMANILKQFMATGNNTCEALFVNKQGRPVSVSWLQRLVKTVGEQAGLPYSLTCNHLRHTFATHAADRHGKVSTKALMGHMNLSTTEVYTHLSPRHFRPLSSLHPLQRRQR